jgi:hypothetical protein
MNTAPGHFIMAGFALVYNILAKSDFPHFFITITCNGSEIMHYITAVYVAKLI